MVPLLAFGLLLLCLALVPGLRRAPLVLAALGAVAAIGTHSVTSEGFLVFAAGVLPVLAGLLLREMVSTAELVAQPRRERRREQRIERRTLERRQEARERARRRRERQRLAA